MSAGAGAPARRRTWAIFVATALAAILVLGALSVASLRSERREIAERARAEHAARLQAAAAAMDRRLGPVLAREAGRHHADYASYRAPRRAFSPDLVRLPAGAVLEPSPLLGFSADAILLHVEWSPESGARSPEAPTGRERELALASGLPAAALQLAEDRLRTLAAEIDFAAIAASVRAEAPAAAGGSHPTVDPATCLASDALAEGLLDAGLVEDAGDASVGRLVARWAGERLVLARDVLRAGHRGVQLVVVDWPAMSRLLLDECAGGMTGARLVAGGDEPGVALATLPVALRADEPVVQAGPWTPLATRLAGAWGAGLVALGAVGWALRTGLAHAERRSRLAAALSHELRTPLTTLRLYSGMLADDVITDPEARREYLATIQAESARLASLVENVLLHARLERTSTRSCQRMTVGQLVESVQPVLLRRAAEAGRPLVVELGDESSCEVEVDRDAVERVLFNLVDNACKHGVDAEDRTLRLEVRRRGRFVDLQVRDHGPGIPHELGSAVFEAFRRGDETGAPGAGLGLALSRSLARELRGELSLVPSERGACFRLSLRLA